MRKTIFIIALLSSYLLAGQNRNGITGYGEIHTRGVNVDKSTEEVVSYLGSEGGLIINNNILFGVYLNALTSPLNYDITVLSEEAQELPNPFSNHEGSIKTTLNNINLGMVAGLNISPDKTLQTTIKGFIGIGTADIEDIIFIPNPADPEALNFESYSSSALGLNLGVDLILQFKLGSSVKIGLPLGYTFTSLFAVPDARFTNKDNVLKDPNLFSGPTAGFNITFGSF